MEKIKDVFELQSSHYLEEANAPIARRLAKLKRLEKSIYKRRDEIKEALYRDHKKTAVEVDLVDVMPVLRELRFAKKNIYKWCADKNVSTPLFLLGSSSHVRYESKGVVLIISPWNFPINLTFNPLISAIASGNCVIVKPSEHVPNTVKVISKIIKECFEEREVAIIEGGVEESKALLKLPFHHIFFTGSPNVGKIVMKQAAEHLTSVTLELGGKSPAIVDKTANLKETARRLLLVKYLINGQICIAPDYVLVHEDVSEKFAKILQEVIQTFIGNDARTSDNYSRIINDAQHARMKELLADSKENGDVIVTGGNASDEDNFIEPTVIISKSSRSRILNEEIFGPILPLKTFREDSEALEFIQGFKRPLAIYIFSKRKKQIENLIKNTRSGATVINAAGLHHYNEELPFGGVNNSGIGKSHGHWGFQEFSNPRAIVKTNFVFHNIQLLMPPYDSIKKRIIDFAVKYL
jgi:aldehyde dehydrogenase (NAD+)